MKQTRTADESGFTLGYTGTTGPEVRGSEPSSGDHGARLPSTQEPGPGCLRPSIAATKGNGVVSSLGGFFWRLFDTDGFPARWLCGTGWTPALGWLHILSDLAIFGAYAAIPASLALFLSRRRDMPFPAIIWLFVAFILCCGVGHLIEALIFYVPVYRLSGLVKLLTAAVSWATVVGLIRIMPAVLRTPTVHAENKQLQSALGDKEREAESLGRMRDQLEVRSTELTLRWRRLQGALDAGGVVGVQWAGGAGRLEWQIGAEEAFRRASVSVSSWQEWPQVLDESARRMLQQAEESSRHGTGFFEVVLPVGRGVTGRRIRLVARLDPPIRNEPATFTGMFRFLGGSG